MIFRGSGEGLDMKIGLFRDMFSVHVEQTSVAERLYRFIMSFDEVMSMWHYSQASKLRLT